MTPDELREACEMAGMQIIRDGDGWAIVAPGGRAIEPAELSPRDDEERAWIESRCADLLVEKVREIGGHGRAMWFAMEEAIPDARWDFMFATPQQRIKAAMAVLKG